MSELEPESLVKDNIIFKAGYKEKMSVIDKFLDIMRLNDDDYEFDNDDYEFDEDDYQEEVKEKRPSRKERKAEQQRTETNFEVTEKRPKQQNKITPI